MNRSDWDKYFMEIIDDVALEFLKQADVVVEVR